MVPAAPVQTPPQPVGGAIQPPIYPPTAVRRREEGRVLLRVDVTPDGLPRSVVVVHGSGSARLDEAATAAVRLSRFVPATRNGQPVEGAVEVPIVFRLR